MKIKLLARIPVDPRHGLTAGREIDVLRLAEHNGRGSSGVWVTGDDGTEVRLHRHEYEIMEAGNGQTV